MCRSDVAASRFRHRGEEFRRAGAREEDRVQFHRGRSLIAGEVDVSAVLDERLTGHDGAARAPCAVLLVEGQRALAYRDEYRTWVGVPAERATGINDDRGHQHVAGTVRLDLDAGVVRVNA